MRTEKAFKNVITSVGSHLLILGLGLLTRRLLLQEFDTELVGYEALLSNIFSIVAIADFGSDGLFVYRFYTAFAKEDRQEIGRLLGMYRTLCAGIGCAVATGLTVVYFLLPIIFAGKVTLWREFRLMYGLYAVSNISSYFLSYRRSLFIASQQEYQAVRVETAVHILLLIAKAILLMVSPNFLLYLMLTSITTVLSQLLVALLSNRQFSDIHPARASLADYRSGGFFSDIKNLYLTKFYYTVNLATDSLLIAFLADARAAALYSNYILIGGNMITLVNKLLSPLTASVADAVNKEKPESLLELYGMFDMLCFFAASALFSGFTLVFQTAIPVFFGQQYLLPFSFVVAYASYAYVYVKNAAATLFRGSFGDFQVSRRYDGYSMVCNLMVSFLVFPWLGLAGITLGTAVSLILIWHGRFKVVESHLFHRRISGLWLREVGQFALAVGETAAAGLLTRSLPISSIGMFLCCIIAVAVPCGINLAIFFHTKAFTSLIDHMRQLLKGR